MSEYSKILNASKKEFKDSKNNATATLSSYLNGANGLAYILKGDKSIDISVAIHLSSEQQQTEEGNYDVGSVVVTSQLDIYQHFDSVGNIFIMDYKGLTIVISRSHSFNEVAKTYHYSGEILQNKNKKFIILDSDEASELFLTNSTVNWLNFGQKYNYKIYPAFLTPPNIEDTYFTINIDDTKALGGVGRNKVATDKLEQYLTDNVTVTLVNGTMNIAQRFLWDMVEQASNKEFFGLNKFGEWKQSHDNTQKGFSIKSNINKMDMRINYYTTSEIEDKLLHIRKATINLIEVH